MKLLPRILCLLTIVCGSQTLVAQCTIASLNWDALDYFATAGYTGYPLTATMSPNQNFAFGKNQLNITYAAAALAPTLTGSGENSTHTGEAGSYGAGDDVQYTGNGTVTLTFATALSNVKFSLYDIDYNQRVTVTAFNGATQLTTGITLAKVGASTLTIAGTATAPTATASATTVVANSSSDGTVNVDVIGPLTRVVITTSETGIKTNGQAADQEHGLFWLSDVSACINSASFPTNYYTVSRPFNGSNGLPNQPPYVLVSANKSVYMVNPATGKAKFIFSDGSTSGTINSVAYDPHRHIIYYCWSLTNNGAPNASERTVRKYDMNTGTATTLINDVNTFGLPALAQGVESGAAAFYDSALYIGIEGGADNGNGGKKTTLSNRESIIWRVDFSGTTPTTATQVYAVSGDTHDWSDFSIKDGLLYDFNGDADYPDYHHYNLQTGANTLVPQVVGPKQTAVGWDGTVYWVSNSIAQYNMAGGTVAGTSYAITSTPAIPNWSTSGAPSFGDAAEAFRPQMDFGDAPASYDPDPLAPAVHDTSSNLRIGANESIQWDRPDAATLGTLANTDTYDDGLAFVRILVTSGNNYQTDVNVFNNTGAIATLAGWIDFNNDGVFQSSEGRVQTVPFSNSMQSISLYWTGIASVLPSNSYTYLRIRLTSASSGMTTANATGWFPDGEVEDYYLPVNSVTLSANVLNFSVKKQSDNQVNITWNGTGQEPGTIYELQRSTDAGTWTTIYKSAVDATTNTVYNFTDIRPTQPISQYRLQYGTGSGSMRYSNTEKITFSIPHTVQVYPNPAVNQINLAFSAPHRGVAVVELKDVSGRAVFTTRRSVEQGWNQWPLSCPAALTPGIYTLALTLSNVVHTEKLVIRKP